MKASILVLPGDGIGQEVTVQAVEALRAVSGNGFAADLDQGLIGGVSIDTHGIAIRPDVLDKARSADAILLGAVGGPKWDDPRASVRPEQALFALRKSLGLFANLRPVRVLPELIEASTLKRAVIEGDDLRRAFGETHAASLEDLRRAYREGRWTTIEDPGRVA